MDLSILKLRCWCFSILYDLICCWPCSLDAIVSKVQKYPRSACSGKHYYCRSCVGIRIQLLLGLSILSIWMHTKMFLTYSKRVSNTDVGRVVCVLLLSLSSSSSSTSDIFLRTSSCIVVIIGFNKYRRPRCCYSVSVLVRVIVSIGHLEGSNQQYCSTIIVVLHRCRHHVFVLIL